MLTVTDYVETGLTLQLCANLMLHVSRWYIWINHIHQLFLKKKRKGKKHHGL